MDNSPGIGSLREKREYVRRMRIRLAALQRHRDAKDPSSGKSGLAVSAGKSSGQKREGDSIWGLEMAIKRWHVGDDDTSGNPH